MNRSIPWGPDINPLELILSCDLSLDQLRNLASKLGELLADLGPKILVDLQDLELSLGNLTLGLGDC